MEPLQPAPGETGFPAPRSREYPVTSQQQTAPRAERYQKVTTYHEEIFNRAVRVKECGAHRPLDLRPLKSHGFHVCNCRSPLRTQCEARGLGGCRTRGSLRCGSRRRRSLRRRRRRSRRLCGSGWSSWGSAGRFRSRSRCRRLGSRCRLGLRLRQREMLVTEPGLAQVRNSS